jgi:hypothetical protein
MRKIKGNFDAGHLCAGVLLCILPSFGIPFVPDYDHFVTIYKLIMRHLGLNARPKIFH